MEYQYSKKDYFKFPEKYTRVLTVADAFKKGELFDKNVPKSEGVKYPERKKEIISHFKMTQGGDCPFFYEPKYFEVT